MESIFTYKEYRIETRILPLIDNKLSVEGKNRQYWTGPKPLPPRDYRVQIELVYDQYDDTEIMVAYMEVILIEIVEYDKYGTLERAKKWELDTYNALKCAVNEDLYKKRQKKEIKDSVEKGKGAFYVGYIPVLYVVPDHRQIGLASWLLKQVGPFIYRNFEKQLLYVTIIPAIVNLEQYEHMVIYHGSIPPCLYNEKEKEMYDLMVGCLDKNRYTLIDGGEGFYVYGKSILNWE